LPTRERLARGAEESGERSRIDDGHPGEGRARLGPGAVGSIAGALFHVQSARPGRLATHVELARAPRSATVHAVTYRQTRVVEVWAWGARVGAVAADPATGRYVFAYTPEWVASGIELSPLMMPLRERPYDNSQWPSLALDAFHGLVPLLADSLPDAFGNALVNAWMAEHGVALEFITPLDRLAYAADRALGALEFRPPADDADRDLPSAVTLADLVLAARLTVRGELAQPQSAHAAIQQLIQVGSSAVVHGPRRSLPFNLRPTKSRRRSRPSQRDSSSGSSNSMA